MYGRYIEQRWIAGQQNPHRWEAIITFLDGTFDLRDGDMKFLRQAPEDRLEVKMPVGDMRRNDAVRF